MPTRLEKMRANLKNIMAMAEQNAPEKTAGTALERSAKRQNVVADVDTLALEEKGVRFPGRSYTPTLAEQAANLKANREIAEEGIMGRIRSGAATGQDSLYAEGVMGLNLTPKAKKKPETIVDVRKRIGTPEQRPGDITKDTASKKLEKKPKPSEINTQRMAGLLTKRATGQSTPEEDEELRLYRDPFPEGEKPRTQEQDDKAHVSTLNALKSAIKGRAAVENGDAVTEKMLAGMDDMGRLAMMPWLSIKLDKEDKAKVLSIYDEIIGMHEGNVDTYESRKVTREANTKLKAKLPNATKGTQMANQKTGQVYEYDGKKWNPIEVDVGE